MTDYGVFPLICFSVVAMILAFVVIERFNEYRKKRAYEKLPPEIREADRRQRLLDMGIHPDTGNRIVRPPKRPVVERETYRSLGKKPRASNFSPKAAPARAPLSEEDFAFLEKYGIPVSATFDANGMKKTDYGARMKELGKELAYGVTPCRAAGHRLRNRSGHCVRCKPEYLAFRKRYSETGFVYVASSKEVGMSKIGFSTDPAARLATLNRLGYGGATDWTQQFEIETTSAGRVEFNSQKTLEGHRTPTTYLREGTVVECNETFSCDAQLAIDVVKGEAEAINVHT